MKFRTFTYDSYAFAQDDQLDQWTMAFLSTAFISLAPIVVLFFVPIFRKVKVTPGPAGEVREVVNEPLLKILVSFAVGGLLGDVFLHLIPHSFEPHHGHDAAHGIQFSN